MALAIDFTADCTARDAEGKLQSKGAEQQQQRKPMHAAKGMEARSRENEGKKPGLAVALPAAKSTMENTSQTPKYIYT